MLKGIPCTKVKALSALLSFIVLVLGIVLYLVLVPVEEVGFGINLCVFQRFTNHPCPGCGMTRAIACFLRGHFSRAMSYNRSVVVVFPLLAFILIKKIIHDLRSIINTPQTASDATKQDIKPC